jgi:hypothetical protein
VWKCDLLDDGFWHLFCSEINHSNPCSEIGAENRMLGRKIDLEITDEHQNRLAKFDVLKSEKKSK